MLELCELHNHVVIYEINHSKNVDDVVDIKFSLIVSQLISLEEREQFMTVKVWLAQVWHDER